MNDTNNKKAIFILGMHRSGTSALARVINLLGAELGKQLMAAQQDNPKGFWEHEEVVQIHDKLLYELGHNWQDGIALPEGWLNSHAAKQAAHKLGLVIDRDFAAANLWAIKDPRLSLTFPLWSELLAERNIQPLCIIAWRNPLEVAHSLQKRDSIAKPAALLCWLAYTIESLYNSINYHHCYLRYDDLLANWSNAMQKTALALSLNWPNSIDSIAPLVDDFLSADLRHHKQEMIFEDNQLELLIKQVVDVLESEKMSNSATADIIKKLHDKWLGLCATTAPIIRQMRCNIINLEKKLADKEHAVKDLEKQMITLHQKLEQLADNSNLLASELAKEKYISGKLAHDIDILQQQLNALLNSNSWKLTKPLRDAKAVFRKKQNNE